MISFLLLMWFPLFFIGHEITSRPNQHSKMVLVYRMVPYGLQIHQLGNNFMVWGLPKWTTLSNAQGDVMKWIYEQWWQDYRRSLRVLIWVMVYVCWRFQSWRICHIHLINKVDNLMLCFSLCWIRLSYSCRMLVGSKQQPLMLLRRNGMQKMELGIYKIRVVPSATYSSHSYRQQLQVQSASSYRTN